MARSDVLKKWLSDLGIGGRGLDILFVLFFAFALVGGVCGAIFDDWMLGAGIGGSAGFATFIALVVWAHVSRTEPPKRH